MSLISSAVGTDIHFARNSNPDRKLFLCRFR